MLHVAQKRNGLKSFAQPHLVSQNAVDVVLVESDHPVEATDLIVSHLAGLQTGKHSVNISVEEHFSVDQP